MAEFQKLSRAEWKEVFRDPCTENWRDRWTLDGLKATVTNSEKGMDFNAGPVRRENASHAVMWTKEMHFEKSMIDYGYDRQAAFYLDGYRTLTGRPAQFAFAAVESEAPFGVRAAPVSPSVIASGRAKYRRALAVLKAERLNNGRFDADYDQPETFDLPRWARQQTVTLYYGGKPIEVSV